MFGLFKKKTEDIDWGAGILEDYVDEISVRIQGVGAVIDLENEPMDIKSEILKCIPCSHWKEQKYIVDRCRCSECASCLKSEQFMEYLRKQDNLLIKIYNEMKSKKADTMSFVVFTDKKPVELVISIKGETNGTC